MKNIITVILMFLCINTLAQNKSDVIFRMADGKAPVIDGIIESLWDTVTQHNIDRSFKGELASVIAYWKAVWNDTAIFVLVSVEDNFHCDKWCAATDDWFADKPEIYFDVNSDLKDGNGPTGAPNGHIQFSPAFENGINQFISYSKSLNSYFFTYAYKITGQSYVYEYAIPFSSLTTNNNLVFNGNVFGFDACIIDRDSLNESRKRAVWSNTGTVNENYMNMDDAGTLELKRPVDTVLQKLPLGIVPEIDGKVEGFWDTIPERKINRNFTGEKPTVSSYWKGVWNDSAIIILVSVNDDYHCDKWCAGTESWTVDLPELYFDVNSDLKDGAGPSGSSGHYQFAPAFENGLKQYSAYTYNWQGCIYKYAYQITGANYVFEYSIPFSSLRDKYKNTFKADYLGFDVCIIDRDSANENRKRDVWRNTGSLQENYLNMDSSGILLLKKPVINKGDSILMKLPVATVPQLDGVVDNLWDTISKQSISRNFKNEFPSVESYWQGVWNDTAIFILVSVKDDYHCDQFCSGSETWNSELTEIYFDVNPEMKDGEGPVGYPNGHLSFTPAFQKDTNRYSAYTKSWQNYYYSYAYKITGQNYVIEFAIPFSSLKDRNNVVYNKKPFGFDVCIIDRDSSKEYRKRAVWRNIGTSDENYINMDDCGIVFLQNSSPTINVISNEGNILQPGSLIDLKSIPSNTTVEKKYVLMNTGSEPLNISSINISGSGFSILKSGKTTLNHKDTAMIKLLFKENSTKTCTGKLTIQSNDAANPAFDLNFQINVLEKGKLINGGNVYGNWYKSDSIYLINGNITIPDDSTLKIEPGVKVKFLGYYYLKIGGTLIAEGNENDTINFSVLDTSGFSKLHSPSGGWLGMYIENRDNIMYNNDTTKLKYCVIDHAKVLNGYVKNQGGALLIYDFKKLQISDCIFENNYSYNNAGAICIANSSDVSIRKSIFRNNISLNEGGAIYINNNSSMIFNDCTVSDNSASTGGGMSICCNSICYISHTFFANNIASNNGGGVYIVVSNSYFTNNVFTNNEALNPGGGGGAITINNCRPYFYNNNICYNRSYNNASGIFLWDVSPAVFTNNIFWGNYGFDGSKVQINITNGQPAFDHCVIEGGFNVGTLSTNAFSGDTSTVFNLNPGFIKAPSSAGISYKGLNADWRVAANSGVINNGAEVPLTKFGSDKDIYGNNRILHNTIDIGATERHNKISTVYGNITRDTFWVADTIKVIGDILVTDSGSVTIAPGSVVVFQEHYKFRAYGPVRSIGTPDAMIKFTINDTTGFSNYKSLRGSWAGIDINNSSQSGANYKIPANDSIIFAYTIIEYAKNTDNEWNKTVGGGIQIKYYSNVRVSNCIIRNNIAYFGGGINIDGFSNPKILSNRIYNNWSASNGGGICISGNSNPEIIGNYIFNNQREGGLYINNSDPLVLNNVISNNQSVNNGGGVSILNSYPVFSNNTIVNNSAAWEGGGLFVNNSNVKIYNTILWGNTANSGAGSIATHSKPVLYNCVVQYGKNDVYPPDISLVNYYEEDPGFKKPIIDVGKSDNAILADWNINSFSSAINNGVNPAFSIPTTDIAGNNRINDKIPDIGAYENQDAGLEFIKQPQGFDTCESSSIKLSVISSDTCHYQWQKDGVNINGANSSTYIISSLKESDEGNYSCIISNSYGKVYGNPAFMKVRTAPVIIENIKGGLVQKEEEANLQLKVEGTKPLIFKWIKDEVTLPDTTNSMQIDSFFADNEGLYKCMVSNICGTITSKTAELYMAPSICMVTVTSKSSRAKPFNTIVWGKESKIEYAKYAIYRESSVAGFYDKIGTVNSSDEREFRDTLVDPREQSFLYKITGIKSDNSETDINLCKFHKTIHLLVTEGIDHNVQLDWDQYIGFPYSTYYIYRSTDGINFDSIDAVSTSSRTWTDLNYKVDGDMVYYYISIKKSDPCHTLKKSGGDIFDQSTSEIEDNRLKVNKVKKTDVQELAFTCYPNPCSDQLNINYYLASSAEVIIEVHNELGKVETLISDEKQLPGYHNYKLNTEQLGLAPGVYTLRLKAGNKSVIYKLIKIK